MVRGSFPRAHISIGVFALVDALTRLAGEQENAGDRTDADEITSVQGAIAVSHSDCLLETVTKRASSTSID
jgi:hypothetical protein